MLLMRSFPANPAGARGSEQLFRLSKNQLDSHGLVPVPHEVPVELSKEFESLAVHEVSWPERFGQPLDETRCVVDARGRFCAATRNRHQLLDLIRDARDAAAPTSGDFQIVQISEREWLLSKWATRYSGFPLGSYMVLSQVGESWQVSAVVVLL